MPWQMSYAAVNDSESAELQTDVMRFMAILAFCLVAIFAIVRSFPQPVAEPQPVTGIATDAIAEPDSSVTMQHVVAQVVTATTPMPVVAESRASLVDESAEHTPPAENKPVHIESVVAAVLPREINRPVLTREVVAEPVPEPIRIVTAEQLAKSQPAVTEPVIVPRYPTRRSAARPAQTATPLAKSHEPSATPSASATAATAQSEPGLSLRFESDSILSNLVARDLIRLYAIEGRQYYRMDAAGNRVTFQADGPPGQYHEMVASTVPDFVINQFQKQFRSDPAHVIWGVTLPAATTQQLRRFVQTHFSGGLVITADATLALAGEG